MDKNRKTAILGIILNLFLLILKLIFGIITNSLILITDAINSFTDFIASIGIYLAVKISEKKADEGHPFGHHRAQPIAGLITAIFIGIVGFEVIKQSTLEYFSPRIITYGNLAIIVMTITFIVKTFMYFYFRYIGKKTNSPAISATSIDSRNDTFIAIIAIMGLIGQNYLSINYLDNIIAIILGIYIIYSGYKVGIENINYLMGASPDNTKLKEIKKAAKSIDGIKGLNEVNAHYIGNYVHVEVHIEVNKNISTKKSHYIGKLVQNQLESLEFIDKAFIHIDPV